MRIQRSSFLAFALFVAACGAPDSNNENVGTSHEDLNTVCGAASTSAVQGRDVSTYQGAFDWSAQKEDGVVFGMARIGDGTGGDDQFANNWASMKSNGIIRGAYQFFEPGEDETTQANLMIAAVGKLGDGDLPCTADVEVTGGQSAATIASKLQNWLTLVEAGTGKTPIIYTGPYFWADNVASTAFAKYPLWIADYGPACPLMPPGWANWTFWQYSDGSGTLDHDVFNGSLAQLQALANGGTEYPTLVHKGAVDINGDGESDICGRSASGVVCEISQKGGVQAAVNGPAWTDASGWNKPEYYFTIQGADIDGDGKGDLCARDADGVFCQMSNGNGFGAAVRGPAWSDAEGWSKPEYYSTIQFADLNGDGKADVCGRAAAGMVCEISSGTGFPTEVLGPVWSDALGWNQPQYYQTIQFADVNGDARMDLCARGANGVECSLFDGTKFGAPIAGPAWTDTAGWNKPEYMETIRFADIDGDGKADVCGRAAAGVVCEISNGAGFPTEITGPVWSDAAGWNNAAYYTTIQFADIDGNGLADLCARDSAGIVCALSNGKDFGTQVTGPTWSTAGGWDAPEYDLTVGFADLDDDGKDDVCARGYAGVQCALSTGTAFTAAEPIQGSAWSDPSGWGSEEYYSTIRYAGARLHPAKVATPGGSSSDGGVGEGTPGNGAAGAPNSGDSSGGCGCTVVDRKSNASMAWLGFGLALAALARRRSKKS